jgi:hypothetical protein
MQTIDDLDLLRYVAGGGPGNSGGGDGDGDPDDGDFSDDGSDDEGGYGDDDSRSGVCTAASALSDEASVMGTDNQEIAQDLSPAQAQQMSDAVSKAIGGDPAMAKGFKAGFDAAYSGGLSLGDAESRNLGAFQGAPVAFGFGYAAGVAANAMGGHGNNH